ncbi:MAG TPA: zinc ribbon domain-containing protein [Actinopolymorphaceae bacterium]|nr:zinc ribbon domain-containing protein [Actinopolymorphaceae bacterium]
MRVPRHRWVAYPGPVPRYDYRCRTCEATFEHAHPMSEASAPTPCPQGHPDTVKLLSTVALGGRTQGGAAGMGAGSAGGGGCCGGACGCGS